MIDLIRMTNQNVWRLLNIDMLKDEVLRSLSPDLDLYLYMHISINNFILNNQLRKMLHSNVSIKSERFDAVYWKLWWKFPFVYTSDFWIFVHTILRNISDMVFLNSKMLFPEKSYRHWYTCSREKMCQKNSDLWCQFIYISEYSEISHFE